MTMDKKELQKKHKCPVCGQYEFEKRLSFEICEVCGWQDDIFDENDPSEETGANPMSLSDYKAKFASGWKPEWIDRMK